MLIWILVYLFLGVVFSIIGWEKNIKYQVPVAIIITFLWLPATISYVIRQLIKWYPNRHCKGRRM
jgi:hypothetical protein